MGWTSPRTWVTGEIVTAAMLNEQLRDNFLYLGDPPLNIDSGLLYTDTTNDRVGIGTMSPETLVDISGPGDADLGTLRITGGYRWLGLVTRNNNYRYTLGDNTGENFELSIYDISAASWTWGVIQIEPDATANSIYINPTGVGLGTTSPEQALDVAGTAQLRRVADADATNTLRDSNVLQFQGAYWDGAASVNREMQLYFEITDSSSYALEIADHEGNERFRLGRSLYTTLFDLNGEVGGSSWLRFREAGTTAYAIAYDTSNNWWKLRAEAGAGWTPPVDIIRIPDAQLTVDGNSTFDDNAFDFHCQECDWRSAFEVKECPECGGKVEWLDDVALVAASTVANKVYELPKETLRRLERLGIINTYGTLDKPGRPEVFLRLTQSYWFALSAIKQLYEKVKALEILVDQLLGRER